MKILDHRSWGTDMASLLLRLLLGGLFMLYHGYGKVENYDMILPQFKDVIGIGSKLSFWLVIFAEFVCGFLLIIGFLTRLAVIPILITMCVAYFVVHGGAPFQTRELAFVFLILAVIVFILGPGRYSIDRLVFKPRL